MNELPENPEVLLEAMLETDTDHMFEAVVLHHLKKHMQNTIIPEFCKKTSLPSFYDVTNAIGGLYTSVLWFLNYARVWRDCETLTSKIKTVVKSALRWHLPNHMKDTFTKMFTYVFQYHLWRDSEYESESFTVEWKGEKETLVAQDFNDFVGNSFSPLVSTWLVELDLVDVLSNESAHAMLEAEIERYVLNTCKGEFEQSWMTPEDGGLLQWLKSKVFPFLLVIFYKNVDKAKWNKTLCFMLYGAYTKLRISEMLDIITDYPESVPTIQDLKLCLQHTRQRPRLIDSLKNDIRNRVLHPGVSTQNIITVYISAVKALRELDSTGVVMEMVLEPCTTYLTQREDAVRMIMQGLLGDEGTNDLAAELANSQETDQSKCWNERVTENPEDWIPDPREADPHKVDKSSRTSDIVTLFIGMYGSKEKFIWEYQKLLSKRLMQTWYDEKSESTEIRNLELLKMRFGEDDMSKCAVMLKDIADSKRINSLVKEKHTKQDDQQSDIDVRTMIVSSHFWPTIPSQTMEPPEKIAELLQLFNKGYEGLKASRSLKWISGVGMVEIEIELNNKKLEFKVPPLQATIISHFEETETWTLAELSDKIKVPPTVLRRKMSFWMQRGVLKQSSTDTYSTTEGSSDAPLPSDVASSSSITGGCLVACDEEEEENSNQNIEKEKKEKDNKMFWFYIKGMLKNFQSLPIDRIHKMLKMFAVNDANMQIELPQLKQILNEKVQQGLLVLNGGKFKLSDDAK
uniref:anaphase-promoting complex subunit 2 n=1 Tax=Ciona intestinalis TaxID=7719 RepID=UPI000180D090|nr:anaphase-promoting complex subunit 2 [Ciona intestinalis]|eukprot:XP_002124151.1 anaphase-promoting complex subunit 2 [Ciona intestinalis]